jgi:hypothetical protein
MFFALISTPYTLLGRIPPAAGSAAQNPFKDCCGVSVTGVGAAGGKRTRRCGHVLSRPRILNPGFARKKRLPIYKERAVQDRRRFVELKARTAAGGASGVVASKVETLLQYSS